MTGFEGSYLGDRARVADDARLECKICWYVYDPAEGDPQWQIEPGTPFPRLARTLDLPAVRRPRRPVHGDSPCTLLRPAP